MASWASGRALAGNTQFLAPRRPHLYQKGTALGVNFIERRPPNSSLSLSSSFSLLGSLSVALLCFVLFCFVGWMWFLFCWAGVGVRSQSQSHSSFPCPSAVRHLVGSLTNTQGLRFAVVSSLSFSSLIITSSITFIIINVNCLTTLKVVSRFNEIVTKQLLDGALTTFNNYSVQQEDIDVCILCPFFFCLGFSSLTITVCFWCPRLCGFLVVSKLA